MPTSCYLVVMSLKLLAGLLVVGTVAVAGCAGGPSAGTTDDALVGPPGADYCKDGTVVRETAYYDSADGKECAMPRYHCLTKDLSACPQLSPRSPDFCKDGTIVGDGSSYVASADGKECAIPSVHCLTKSLDACPQLSPLAPSFCSDGKVERGEPSYISSADGKECAMPSVHCLTKDLDSCPKF